MAKVEDDLPSADAERKETEELLSGFDRPQRTPRRGDSNAADFVEYHERQPVSEPRSARIVIREPSLVVPKHAIPSAVKWIAVLLLATSVAGTATWILTPASAQTAGAPPASSSAPALWVPPPPPAADETPAVAVSAPPKTTKPKVTPAAATKPRNDFVRDL